LSIIMARGGSTLSPMTVWVASFQRGQARQSRAAACKLAMVGGDGMGGRKLAESAERGVFLIPAASGRSDFIIPAVKIT
jgi:hypothetical protein